MEKESETTAPAAVQANLFGLLKPYAFLVGVLIVLTIGSNALSLIVPKIISSAIDTYSQGAFNLTLIGEEFFAIVFSVFLIGYLQGVLQTYTSERVARDLRVRLTAKISGQDYSYIEEVTPSKLLTNLTSDVDAVKSFVSQAVATIVSSIFVIIGASVLLLFIDWKLALAVLVMVPLIAGTFAGFLLRVRSFFTKSQEAIDWLNKVITENILGAGLIRLLYARDSEYKKFLAANEEAQKIGFSILRLFAALLPVLFFITELATLTILLLGGRYVIGGTLSLGNFAAFNSYLLILIFPIIMIGFMSNVIAQADASYKRIAQVLFAPDKPQGGTLVADLKGDVDVEQVSLVLGDKDILRDVSLSVPAGTRTAIIGPTAAGKTQLLNLLIGLLKPKEGVIKYDGKPIDEYDKKSLHNQIGFVFQDSVIFNLTLRENIAFSNTVKDEDIQKAIETAELSDFIQNLPDGLDTVLSERGTSISGGQKQRLMLARALALNPRVLLLDDFTARVDVRTERTIVENLRKNYPELTLISVTQKIAPIEKYDQIVLLMEGEVLASGTHEHLLETSPEYAQIFESQKSTNAYELQA
ncbi:MAG: ABC transporter ATP-binding protein [Minisyncoccia bacterium]